MKNFDAWGKHDPLWAILTAPGKKGNKWKTDEFFKTGVEQVDGVIKYLETIPVDLKRGRALDFGCGVGRLTQALGNYFDEVCGVDIAPSMIKLANDYNGHGEKIKYFINKTNDLSIFPDNEFDFILTLITLQHMEPRYSMKYMKEFIRILKFGGVLVFQIPAAYARPSFGKRIEQSIRYRTPVFIIKLIYSLEGKEVRPPLMEMYGIDRDEVERLLNDNGAKVIDVLSMAKGKPPPNFRYCVTKE
ncbi:MAG: class I SAM-dependent methyltransferase [bacterium]